MENLNDLLKKLGYNNEDINKITKSNNLRPETLLYNIKNIYDFLIKFGYSQTRYN